MLPEVDDSNPRRANVDPVSDPDLYREVMQRELRVLEEEGTIDDEAFGVTYWGHKGRVRFRRQLNTIGKIRAEMNRIYRMAVNGEVPASYAHELTYMLERQLKAVYLETETGQHAGEKEAEQFTGLSLIGPPNTGGDG